MANITNPEKQCKTTPESFSEESKIEGVEKDDSRRGIILDSPEEFAQALIVYDGGSVQGSRATQNNLMDAVGNTGGGMGAALLSMAGARNSGPDPLGFTFADKLAQQAVASLQKDGRFHRSFDYDAMGTNFFKTTVTGQKVGGKCVLELCAAYVGTEPEGKLAETLGKPMALINSNANGRLSIVDDWWFNLNLEDAVKELPLPKEDLRNVDQWAQYLASGGYGGKSPEFEFKYKKKGFALTIGLDADRYLRPEGGEQGSNYMQARGKSIVGGSWTTWAENRQDKCNPRIVQPSITFSVSLPGEKYSKLPIVTSDEMKVVQDARDYIASLIHPKK